MSTQQTISITTTHPTGFAYLSTCQGVFKIIEILSSLIAALLAGIQYHGYKIDIFLFSSIVSLTVAFIFLIIYLTGLIRKIGSVINRVQFFFHTIWAIYYFITVILLWSYSHGVARIVAAGFFGLIASVMHICDGIDNYKKYPFC